MKGLRKGHLDVIDHVCGTKNSFEWLYKKLQLQIQLKYDLNDISEFNESLQITSFESFHSNAMSFSNSEDLTNKQLSPTTGNELQ